MVKMICFDMDGTIADLYGVKDWLPRLRAEDASPYIEAKPLLDMEILRELLGELTMQGWEIRVISWLSKDASRAYDNAVREAKREWLTKHRFPAEKCHFLRYGTTKASAVRNADYAILVDDNAKIRHGWHKGATIDANDNIIEALIALLD